MPTVGERLKEWVAITELRGQIASLDSADRCDHENDGVADTEGYIGCKECDLRRQIRALERKGHH